MKHLHLSISSRAICKLKWCAGILIRQAGSDIIKLIYFTYFDGKTQSWDKYKFTFLALQHTEYQNTNFRVVMLSRNYLPSVLGLNTIKYVLNDLHTCMSIHDHENYCKSHSLKILLFHK